MSHTIVPKYCYVGASLLRDFYDIYTCTCTSREIVYSRGYAAYSVSNNVFTHCNKWNRSSMYYIYIKRTSTPTYVLKRV